jgi:hypothetical protein
MFDLLKLVVEFLFEAAVSYASTPQGAEELNAIGTIVEGYGIDIPLWQPANPQGTSGIDGDSSDVQSETVSDPAAAYAARHPKK